MASTPAARPARSVQLDVIRAFAILLVIGAHLLVAAPDDGIIGSFAWAWHEYGGFGVPLFFTLSGYLVGGLLISEVQRHGSIDIRRFLIRRGLKIWPAYFVFLGYLVAMPILRGRASLHDQLADYWPNALFLHNYVGPNPALHTWSLAVEEHFYLALPFLLLAIVRLGLMRWIAPLFLMAPVFTTLLRVAYAASGDPYMAVQTMVATHLWADALLVGVGVRALAEFSPDLFAGFHAWRWPLLAAGALLLAIVTLPMPKLAGVPINRIIPIITMSATALLIGTLHLKLAGRTAAVLAWIGMYSYGIYLWHVAVVGVVHRSITLCCRKAAPRNGWLLRW
ncbi:acyltransferase [Bradyrhizobium sp. 31Argb]|uniref:acyltransferase family protein n=1 Tax=Bradyrhizobium sp. 31Argb TaxID=3141247 RepID=UPI00374875E0